MKNIRGKRRSILFVGAAVAFSVVVVSGGFSSKVLADTPGAKYQVGNTIRIAGNAWSETNGYSLVSHQNWYGTVVSVKPKQYSNSSWEYYIRYPNGYHNDHVAEQDVTNIPASRYSVGSVARITNNAWSETNGYSLRDKHNWVGTIVSVTPKAYSMSAWQYKIVYPNGWHNDYVADQDLTNIANAKFNVGDTVQVASNAWSETNGYTLTNRRNWVGTVVSRTPKAYSNSAWEYDIKYSNGIHSVHVSEQDLEMSNGTATGVATKPTYFSQLDNRWASARFRHTTIGTDGCVPTSLAMVLNGSYGLNVNPVSVAQKMAPMNSWYDGASGTDLVKTAQAYGRSVEEISDKNRAIAVLKSGVPLIMYVNVGIGHAIVVTGYNNGQVNTYDPYNWKFYGSVSSFDAIWNNPSVDYNMDWDAGRPVFAIR